MELLPQIIIMAIMEATVILMSFICHTMDMDIMEMVMEVMAGGKQSFICTNINECNI